LKKAKDPVESASTVVLGQVRLDAGNGANEELEDAGIVELA